MSRPIVCLNMIVKNEAHVIARCLASVRPHIDAWAICDTGSDDGTQDLVRRVLADLPGALQQRPWQDFAHNRNEALALAAGYGSHALIIDADETLIAPADHVWPIGNAPGYEIEYVLHPSATVFFRPALVRLDAGWRWQGVLHEALVRDGHQTLPRVAGASIHSHADGARSQLPIREKYARDAVVLKAALEREPENARYWFYYAQSLRDAGRPAEALAAYRHRISLGGWDQEVFYSAYQLALAMEGCGADDAQIMAAYLDAYERRPSRAEPLLALARYCRERGRHASAALFAERAAALPLPDDALFVERSVYGWRTLDELALARYHTGEPEEAGRLWRRALADPDLGANDRQRIERNLSYVPAVHR